MRNKHGIEFNFAWLFAIIVGAVIIILAVYAVSNFIEQENDITNSETAVAFSTLLHPVETNLESSSFSTIVFQSETRVHNTCVTSVGSFGEQRIATSVQSSVGEPWQRPITSARFNNKYLFSKEIEQGERIYVFAKPFELPYKVGDITTISTEFWCFVDPPNSIAEELTDLNMTHMRVVDDVSSCAPIENSVCFGSQGCDIRVLPTQNRVEHASTAVYYQGPLVYAAIMSDPDIYECQVQRLGLRTSELALLLADKTDFLSGQGCTSNLGDELRSYAQIAHINASFQLGSVAANAEELGRRNEPLRCKLF